MNNETTALIEKLADKLGTTTEHLWGVLLHQAPISGAVDLATILVMALGAVVLVRVVKLKTTTPPKTEDRPHPQAEWDGEAKVGAWAGTIVYLVLTGAVIFGSAHGIVAAFFNPEYWALSQLLGKI